MATDTIYKCEVCGKELSYSGRGRPPKRCEEHRNAPKAEKEKKVEEVKTRARPRPGAPKVDDDQKSEQKAPEAPPRGIPTVGQQDVQSRAKAESAARRTVSQQDQESWPISPSGRPMAKVSFSVSELIPTGQYANVSVGPVQIHAFVDLDRVVDDEYFSDSEKQALATAANELAHVIEYDIIGVQRNLILESLQDQLSNNGS